MLNTFILAAGLVSGPAPRSQVCVDTTMAVVSLTRDDISSVSSPLAGFDLKNLPTPSQALGAYTTSIRGLQSKGALQGLDATALTNDAFGGTVSIRGMDLQSIEVLKGPSGTLYGSELGFQFTGGAGTICVPTKGNYQPMVAVTPMFFNSFNFEDLYVSLETVQSNRIRALCGAMKKAEPDASVSFIPVPCKDKVIVALAKITEASRIRGPWDQARMWIYTDRATLTEINDRLAPAVSGSRYVDALHDVFEAEGLGSKDLENSKMFDPALVWADASSAAWFCRIMANNQAKALAKELSSNTAGAKAFFKGDATDGKDHLAAILPALLAVVDKDVLVGTLTFLTKVVPQPQMSWVTKVQRLNELKSHQDPRIAKLAAEAALRYGV